MAKKQLRVGMIGYGFMGRAHSNAYKQVGQFFPSNHEVVLKAACARNEAEIKAFADQWGYESTETDWRKLVARQGHRRRSTSARRTTCTRRSPSPRPRPAR